MQGVCFYAHLKVIFLTGIQGVAAEVSLELYFIFKGLIGGREGHRGEKLKRQTTEQKRVSKQEKGEEATEYDKKRENGI